MQSKMALLAYICKKEAHAQLPDPCDPIGQEVGKNLMEEANKEVVFVLENSMSLGITKLHEPYLKLTPEQRQSIMRLQQ